MSQHKLLINSQTFMHQYSIGLATLLLVAQLFTQLHTLSHLDHDVDDIHGEEQCLICILSTGLDNADVPVVADTEYSNTPQRITTTSRRSDFGYSLNAYKVRAPPQPASIA